MYQNLNKYALKYAVKNNRVCAKLLTQINKVVK